MDVKHQRMVATEPPMDFCARSLLDVLHPGLPRAREVGLIAQQHENLVVAKGQAKRYPGCLATVSLDRNPAAQWATVFGVHGVVNVLRTGNDFIWLLQYDGSSDRFALSRCLHPMERCALQGFLPGNAMSTPVVAAALKRCVEFLAC